jgi:hypothetical protein
MKCIQEPFGVPGYPSPTKTSSGSGGWVPGSGGSGSGGGSSRSKPKKYLPFSGDFMVNMEPLDQLKRYITSKNGAKMVIQPV